MTGDGQLMVAVLGDDEDGNVSAAVERGGGRPGAVADACALIWSGGDVEDLAGALEQASGITWVQLPSAGIESFRPVVQRWPDLTWTCAKEIYGAPVAEQALALLLALRRGLPEFARAGRWSPEVLSEPLLGSGDVVTILGGGGIAVSLARLLAPLGVHVRVQRRSVAAGFDGPHAELFGEDQLAAALDGARALVVTLPLTDATRGLLGAPELRRLARGAVVLNVGRGPVLDTAALPPLLADGTLRGVGLDVTDPEPLPDDSPLWRHPACLVTAHTANPAPARIAAFAGLVTENVRRRVAGEPLRGLVDVAAGY